MPSCPQTFYIQQALETSVPVSILSSPSPLCSLPTHRTPPTAGPDAKPTSSGLPGREGKGYLVLQPSSHPGRSAAGYLRGAAASLERNTVLSPPVTLRASGTTACQCSGLQCSPTWGNRGRGTVSTQPLFSPPFFPSSFSYFLLGLSGRGEGSPYLAVPIFMSFLNYPGSACLSRTCPTEGCSCRQGASLVATFTSLSFCTLNVC